MLSSSKNRKWAALFLAITLLGVQSARSQNPVQLDSVSVLQQYKDAQNSLEQILSKPVSCSTLNGLDQPDHCSFKGMCRAFDQSAGNANLYVNASGERIPNYYLQYAEHVLTRCYLSKAKNSEGADNDNGMLHFNMADSLKLSQKLRKETLEAKRKFYDSVKKHHEQKAFDAVYDSAIDLALDETSESSSKKKVPELSLPSLEGLTDSVRKAEKKARVKLSDESRKLYAQFLLLESDPMGTAELSKELREKQKNDPKNRIVNQDPFISGDLFFDANRAYGKEAVLANQKKYQQAVDRSFKIFDETRKAIIQRLNKQRTPENSDRIDNMISRISTITLNAPNTMMLGRAASGFLCPGPNAFYNPNAHQFTLCPQIMMMPSTGLKAIITHELGHSIDPCDLAGDLISIKGLKKDPFGLDDPALKKQMESQSKETAEKNGFYYYDAKVPEKRPEDEAIQVDLIKSMTDGNVNAQFKNATRKTIATGIGLDKNPFSTVVSCLSSTKSVGARISDPDEITDTIDEEISRLKKTGASSDSPQVKSLEKAKSEVPKLAQRYRACSGIMPGSSGRTQIQEAFSDWIAGEVVGEDVSSPDLTSEEKKRKTFESVGFFLGLGCPRVKDAAINQIRALAEKQGCTQEELDGPDHVLTQLHQLFGRMGDEHPLDDRRVERMFLVQPQVRAALGCEGLPKGRYCE